jgi:hypothetical protein
VRPSNAAACPKFCTPTHDTTPYADTALAEETIEVTDPEHRLYGLRLPLVAIVNHQRLGRVCRVLLDPGIERGIPIGATDRSSVPRSQSPCRLSLASSGALLQVVASLPDGIWDHADRDRGIARATTGRKRDRSSARAIARPERAGRPAPVARNAARSAPTPGLGESRACDSGPSPERVSADLPGARS